MGCNYYWCHFCGTLVIILGAVIYYPIEFLVYEPLFAIDWEDGRCLHTSLHNYELGEYYNKSNGEWDYFDYTTYDVVLDVDGKRYKAFGCGSSNARVTPGTKVGKPYPYSEFICRIVERCGS